MNTEENSNGSEVLGKIFLLQKPERTPCDISSTVSSFGQKGKKDKRTNILLCIPSLSITSFFGQIIYHDEEPQHSYIAFNR